MLMLVTCSCITSRSCLLVDDSAPSVLGHSDCSSLGAMCRASMSSVCSAEASKWYSILRCCWGVLDKDRQIHAYDVSLPEAAATMHVEVNCSRATCLQNAKVLLTTGCRTPAARPLSIPSNACFASSCLVQQSNVARSCSGRITKGVKLR